MALRLFMAVRSAGNQVTASLTRQRTGRGISRCPLVSCQVPTDHMAVCGTAEDACDASPSWLALACGHKAPLGADGKDAGLEQLRMGLAWHYQRYVSEQPKDDIKIYAAAEREAEQQGDAYGRVKSWCGLWSGEGSINGSFFIRNGSGGNFVC